MKTPDPCGIVPDRTFRYNNITGPRKPHWSFDPKGQARLNRIVRATTKALNEVRINLKIKELISKD